MSSCELDVAIGVEGPLADDAPHRALALRAVAFGQEFEPVALSPSGDGGRWAAQLAASLRLAGSVAAAAGWVATNEPVQIELLDTSHPDTPPPVLATCTIVQPQLDGADASEARSGWALADAVLSAHGQELEGAGGWEAWRCRLRLRLRTRPRAAGAQHGPAQPGAAAGRAHLAESDASSRLRLHLLLRFSTLRLRRGLSAAASDGSLQLEASFAHSPPFASALVRWSDIARAHGGGEAGGRADELSLPLATEFVGGALARLDFAPSEFGAEAVLRTVRDSPMVMRLVLHAAPPQRGEGQAEAEAEGGGAGGGARAEGAPVELAVGPLSLAPLAVSRLHLARDGSEAGADSGALATSGIVACEGSLAVPPGAEHFFSAPRAGGGGSESAPSSDSWSAEGLPDDAVCLVTVHAQLCAQQAQPQPQVRGQPQPQPQGERRAARSRSPPEAAAARRRAPSPSAFEWPPGAATASGGAYVRPGSAAAAAEWQYRLSASVVRVSEAGMAQAGALSLSARLHTRLGAAEAGGAAGGGRAVSTRPAVPLARGSSAAFPPHALSLVLAGSPASLVESLHRSPLLLELWHRDRYAADELVGVAAADLAELLTAPPAPLPLAAALGSRARAALARGAGGAGGGGAAAAPVWRRQLRLNLPVQAVPPSDGAAGGAASGAPVAFALLQLELFESPLPAHAQRASRGRAGAPPAAGGANARPATAGSAPRRPTRGRGAAGTWGAEEAEGAEERVPRRLLDALQRQFALRERQREAAQAAQAASLLQLEARLRAHGAQLRRREAAVDAKEASAGKQLASRLRAAESALAAAALAARSERNELSAEQARMAATTAELTHEADTLRAQLHTARSALSSVQQSTAAQLAASRAEASALKGAVAELEEAGARQRAQIEEAAQAKAAGEARLRAALLEAEAVRVAHERQIARLLQHSAKQSASLSMEALARAHSAEQEGEAAQLAQLRAQLAAETERAQQAEAEQGATASPALHAPAAPRAGAASPPPAAAPGGSGGADAQPDDDSAQAMERLRQRRDGLLQSGLYTTSDALIVRMQAQLKALVERAADI